MCTYIMLLHSVSAPSAGLCGCCFCFPLTEEYLRPYWCSIRWQIKQSKITATTEKRIGQIQIMGP